MQINLCLNLIDLHLNQFALHVIIFLSISLVTDGNQATPASRVNFVCATLVVIIAAIQ